MLLRKGKMLTLNKCALLDHWQFGLSYVFHISGLCQEAISGTAPHHASLSNTSSLNSTFLKIYPSALGHRVVSFL